MNLAAGADTPKDEEILGSKDSKQTLYRKKGSEVILNVLQNSDVYTPEVVKEQFELFYKELEATQQLSWSAKKIKAFNASMCCALYRAFTATKKPMNWEQAEKMFAPPHSSITFQRRHNKGLYTPLYVKKRLQKDFLVYLKSRPWRGWGPCDLQEFDAGMYYHVLAEFKIANKVYDRDGIIQKYFYTQGESPQEIEAYKGLLFVPRKTYYSDEKIRKNFKTFALQLIEQKKQHRGPTDLERFNTGLYLHLCDLFRKVPGEINWSALLAAYADKDLIDRFSPKIEYTPDDVRALLQEFFAQPVLLEQKKWSLNDFKSFNKSVYDHIQGNYHPKNKDNRKNIFLDFVPSCAQILTKFQYQESNDYDLNAQKKFKRFFRFLSKTKQRFWNPKKLERFDRNFHEHLKRTYRDEEGAVDWGKIIETFELHRYSQGFRYRMGKEKFFEKKIGEVVRKYGKLYR